MPRPALSIALLLLTACRGDAATTTPGDVATVVDSAADGAAASSSICTDDAQCAAVLPGLPPCRAARCDAKTGGCFVEAAPEGAPCVPMGEAGCGGRCADGTCAPTCP